ncbi:unnamed protein product [Cuscuta campestris]|uniref:Uncharacterized protein n=1 Tax=Cuscuta campestris TaxID=132261 RepID=A0A484N1Z1_9ASTE|nr:unnamed protein product [Cuscuta campestris]
MGLLSSILKCAIVIFIFALLAQNLQASVSAHSSTLQPLGDDSMYGISEGKLHPQDCSPRCVYRCSKTAYKKPCLFFCNKCCNKCLCVPAGTYGNKQSCPCYNNWKTKRGGPKCP